jgi:DNA adenine methylase
MDTSARSSGRRSPGCRPSGCRPFLKWAGGKTGLLPELLARVPAAVETYYEPFLGGGALFFALASPTLASRTPRPARAVLSDVNPDLVAAYVAVRDEVGKVVRYLAEHAREHEKHGLEHYLAMRAVDPYLMEGAARAAWTIYLNKTCWNGLWRVNRRGRFNVPMGRFKTPPRILDEPGLRACSAALAGVEVYQCPFHQLVPEHCRRGDFVYLDPPYVPLPRANSTRSPSFTSYAAEGFGPADQSSLAHAVRELARKKVDFLLSNAGCPEVVKLYAGFEVEEVRARRNINSRGDSRGPVAEYLVSRKLDTVVR